MCTGKKGGVQLSGPQLLETADRLHRTTTVEHLRSLQEQLPDNTVMKAESDQLMEKIRVSCIPPHPSFHSLTLIYLKYDIQSRKQQEVEARKEREKRRRRVLHEQEQIRQQIEEKRVEDALIAKILKLSEEEKRMSAELQSVEEVEQQVRQNRLDREQAYQKRRELEMAQADMRIRHAAAKEKEAYLQQVSM